MSRATTGRHALGRAEVVTSVVALAASTGAYLAGGNDYLARAALGDVLGLATLAVVVIAFRRRLRHEALWCLGWIAAVHLWRPDWPLDVGGGWWWAAVIVAVAAYVGVRDRMLSRAT